MNVMEDLWNGIGPNKPCFIIAEAGVNHNGDLAVAKKLIDAAAESGADAVKFQTFKSEELVTKKADAAEYQKKNIGREIKQIDLIKSLELSYESFEILKEYCDSKNILFLSTPHSFDAIDFLDRLVPIFKFGSGDITNIPTLKYAAAKGKPIILGTGMSDLKEIKEAIEAIHRCGNSKIIALHCTTSYPCPLEEVNMNAMKTMQKNLDCLIGYSDHTLGITIPIMAASLGAVVIEKHFTLDRTLPGPDHKASLEPDELKMMVQEIRNVEKARGTYEKMPTISEKNIVKKVRKSIVAKKDIKTGDHITEEMIGIKRPGSGISPKHYESVIGKKAIRDIKKDDFISMDDIL